MDLPKPFREVEVKILEIPVEKVVSHILELGAQHIFTGDLVSWYYDFPPDSPYRLKQCGKQLRVRDTGLGLELCLKEKLESSTAKVVHEYELDIPNTFPVHEFLGHLGLTLRRTVLKHRASYLHSSEDVSTRFEFDTVSLDHLIIPTFLEIETSDEQHLASIIGRLGYTLADTVPWTTTDVIKHYQKSTCSNSSQT